MQPEGLQELERFLQAFSLRGIMKTPISQGVALGCVLRPRWGRCGSGGASVFCRWSRNRGCPLVVLHIFLMGIRLTRTATLTVDDWKRLAGAPQGCLPSAEGDGDRPVLRSFSEAGLWAFRCPRTRGTRKMRVQTASSARRRGRRWVHTRGARGNAAIEAVSTRSFRAKCPQCLGPQHARRPLKNV